MKSERYIRQGFLGANAGLKISNSRVAIIGAGGGGSPIAQALAYLGFINVLIYDFDHVEESNLNRLIGATLEDAKNKTLKVDVAERMIKSIQPDARVTAIAKRWQEYPELLKSCDIVFGCVDSYSERQQIEAICRRFLIPYFDIGLDVYAHENEAPQMAGQVILSIPDEPCMWCMGFLSDEKIGLEAAKYGQAGPRPQVVYANGILANTAVALAVDLITDWSKSLRQAQYLLFYANNCTMNEHPRMELLKENPIKCIHLPRQQVGNIIKKKL